MSRKPTDNNKMAALKRENLQLKAEVQRLKKTTPAPKRKKTNWLNPVRKITFIVLVSFAVALLTVSNLLFWFGNTVVKPDRFVAATQPIIKDPVVQKTMALYTTNSIFNNVDVQQNIEQVLPPRADFLAPQLTSQLKSLTQSTLQKVLAKPSFQQKWNQALARQHQRIINFASKYQGNGDISLNDVFANLTDRLAGTKLGFLANKQLPSKIGDITIISAPWLPAFHNVVVHIDMWRTLAAILLVLAVAGAVWLSRNRRRTLYIFSVASILMMLATLLALHIIRDRILGKVDPQYAEGVRHVLQIVFHSLVIQTVTIMAAAFFIWLVTWISGSSRSAKSVKKQVGLLFAGKLHSRIFAQDKPWTTWIQKNKRALEWGAVALIGIVMLLVRLTLKALILYALLLLIMILVIEVISGQETKLVKK